MAVTAIHPRPRRGRSSPLRTVSLLALVVAWAAVFGVAYTLGSKARSRSSAPSSAPSLATGSGVPASASLTINGSRRSAQRVAITALPQLPAPPTLKPLVISRIVARARTYYVPVYRPAAPAGTPATAPTGGGPHGSGGTGGGTTTVGGASGGGGLGSGTTTTPTTTTPTTTTSTTPAPTTSTPTPPTPSGG